MGLSILTIGPDFSGSNVAQATVATRASLQSLTEQAQLIILGKVTSQWTPKERGPQGQIYTQTSISVSETWKGVSVPSLTIQQLGGTLDGFTLQVSGSPGFTVGQEYVLFLVKSTQEELFHVVSLAQGVYQVSAPTLSQVGNTVNVPRTVRQDLKGITFYQSMPPQGPATEGNQHLVRAEVPTNTLTLDELKARVLLHLGEK